MSSKQFFPNPLKCIEEKTDDFKGKNGSSNYAAGTFNLNPNTRILTETPAEAAAETQVRLDRA
jgi:hypothetical protein